MTQFNEFKQPGQLILVKITQLNILKQLCKLGQSVGHKLHFRFELVVTEYLFATLCGK